MIFYSLRSSVFILHNLIRPGAIWWDAYCRWRKSPDLSCAHQHFHSLHTFFKSNCSPASSVKCLSNYSAVVRHSNFSFCRLISRSFFSFPLFGYRIDDRQQKNDWTSARQTGRERARERKWKCEKLAWRKTKELSFVVEISRFLRGSNTELLVAKKKES